MDIYRKLIEPAGAVSRSLPRMALGASLSKAFDGGAGAYKLRK